MANAPADGPAGLAAFTAGFEHRTGYEWLSRDVAEVNAYVADPWCGWDVSEDVTPSLFDLRQNWPTPHSSRASAATYPSSSRQATRTRWPQGGVLLEQLGQRYQDAGVADVTVKLYPAARHEILNETNRDEVTGELMVWLRERVEMS